MSYRDHVSDEPLEIIRANECDAQINLATKRFRRLWNEIESLRAKLEAAVSDAQRMARTDRRGMRCRDCQDRSAGRATSRIIAPLNRRHAQIPDPRSRSPWREQVRIVMQCVVHTWLPFSEGQTTGQVTWKCAVCGATETTWPKGAESAQPPATPEARNE